jgi:hypothetical protein
MKLKAVGKPSPLFSGCQYTGRTFHKWALSFIDPRSGHKHLERKCQDCGVRQHVAGVPNQETRELPRSLWCLGDWQWSEGSLEP